MPNTASDSAKKIMFMLISLVGDKNECFCYGEKIQHTQALAASGAPGKAFCPTEIFHINIWRLSNKQTTPTTEKAFFSSFKICLKPAPPGLGLSGSPTVKKIVDITGIKDCDFRVTDDGILHINSTHASNKAPH